MLLIYLPFITPRCEYVFNLIFREELSLPYKLTTDYRIFEDYKEEKICYDHQRNTAEFFIKASSLLFDHEVRYINITTKKEFDTTILFVTDNSCDVGFDIFSAVFYMISRYEEYLPYTPDMHGRYRSSDSLAYRNHFLHQPVVDIWINIFKEKLITRFPHLQLKPSKFKAIITYDIDVAYAFAGRNIFRFFGATLKDMLRLKVKNIIDRLRLKNNPDKDPWNVYNELSQTILNNKMNAVIFFLLGDYSKYDRNLSPAHPLMKKLVQQVLSFSEIGIHPSYQTSAFPQKILTEKQRLENLAEQKITKSRQHYLKFTLPDTYNHLIEAGITQDYSMGFSALPGFRAGTCKPFYFYDLKNEKATSLRIFPITFMEGTLLENMKLSADEAFKEIEKLMLEVKKVNGTFISLWHNHTISNAGIYKGWKNIHDKMIEQILLTK